MTPRSTKPPANALNAWRAAFREGGVLSLVLVVLTAWAGTALWHAWDDIEMAQALQTGTQPGDIRMLSSTTCAYCAQARRWMTEHRVPFDECFVEEDTACAADYVRTGHRGTPTLLVRGQTQLGFNASRVAKALQNP